MIEGVISSRTCLLPMITPESRFWLRLYSHYKKQFLPFAGGILDQPAKYAEAMEVLDSTFRRIEADQIEEAKAQ